MSQHGTTPTTDENRAPTGIPTPIFVPMMPMFIPYGNANTAGQTYYASTVYPNVPAYQSTGNHRHGNFGPGYSTLYASFYPTSNNLLSPATHIINSSALIPPRPLMMPPPMLPISHQPNSSAGSLIAGIDNDRNKNLNIRECQSPIQNKIIKEKRPLQIVDPNDLNREDSSSASSIISHSESDQNLLPPLASSSLIQEIDSDNPQDDFLTFIEQQTKTTTAMPELNPFANEFSFVNNQTLTKDSTITTNGIDHHTDDDDDNNQTSYRLLFDNLIEKSLESIEAMKKSTKKTCVNDASIQCNPISDTINRSTQTTDQVNHNDLLEECSLRTIKVMDKLLEDFRNIYQDSLHNQYQTMAHTCDELRHLILFIHHIVSSSTNVEQQKQSSIDLDNPFSNMIHDLGNDMTNINRYQTSSQITHGAGRGTRRLITSTNNSSLPSFSCRQIDPIIKTTSKICLLCQRPIDESDDVMHKLCRLLSSNPNMSGDK